MTVQVFLYSEAYTTNTHASTHVARLKSWIPHSVLKPHSSGHMSCRCVLLISWPDSQQDKHNKSTLMVFVSKPQRGLNCIGTTGCCWFTEGLEYIWWHQKVPWHTIAWAGLTHGLFDTDFVNFQLIALRHQWSIKLLKLSMVAQNGFTKGEVLSESCVVFILLGDNYSSYSRAVLH